MHSEDQLTLATEETVKVPVLIQSASGDSQVRVLFVFNAEIASASHA